MNELFSWVLALPEWDEGDAEKAYHDLIGFVRQTEPAWKKGLREDVEIGEKSDYVESDKIKDIVNEWNEETTGVPSKELSEFLHKNFKAKKIRLPLSQGKKTVWEGIKLKDKNKE